MEKKKILALIGVFIIICAIVGIGYLVMIKNPQTLFKTVINTGVKELSKLNFDSKEISKFELDSKLVVDYDFLKDYIFNINVKSDSDLEKAEIKLDLIKGDDSQIAANLFYSNNDIFVNFNSLPNNLYKIATSTIDDLSGNLDIPINSETDLNYQINSDDIKYISDKLRDLLFDTFKKEQFSKEDANIEINGKNEKVTKNIYHLDNEAIKSTLDNIINGMINDEEFINRLTSITNLSKDDLLNYLTESKNELDTIKDEAFNIYIYTKGLTNKIVRVEGTSSNDENALSEIIYIDIEDYKYTISTKLNGDFKIIIETNKKRNYFKIKTNEDNFSIELKINESNKDLIKGTLKVDFIISEEKINATYDFTINYSPKFSSIDTSKSINIEDMTPLDLEMLMDSISKIDFLDALLNIENSY